MHWLASIGRETLMAKGAGFRKAQQGKTFQEAYRAQVRRRAAGRGPARRARSAETGRRPRRAAVPLSPLPDLSGADRQRIIDTFIDLLGGLYAHLPLKRAMYAIDPLQRLRLLRQGAPDMEESAFHHELEGIITRLRD